MLVMCMRNLQNLDQYMAFIERDKGYAGGSAAILCVLRSHSVEMRILVNKALGMRFDGKPWT